jgi:TonB family protein
MYRSFASIIMGITLTFVGFAQTDPPKPPPATSGGMGSGPGPAAVERSREGARITPLQILSKPRPTYTAAARENGIEGSVLLKVTLLASGDVGAVTPVKSLPHGLTERAIAAAKQMRFTPKTVNGVPVSVVQTLEYTFTRIPDENDRLVAKKAMIIQMPPIQFPAEPQFDNLEGKLEVTVIFGFDGKASLESVTATVSPDIEKWITDALRKIIFKPAESGDGTPITVARKVIYEIKPRM